MGCAAASEPDPCALLLCLDAFDEGEIPLLCREDPCDLEARSSHKLSEAVQGPLLAANRGEEKVDHRSCGGRRILDQRVANEEPAVGCHGFSDVLDNGNALVVSKVMQAPPDEVDQCA